MNLRTRPSVIRTDPFGSAFAGCGGTASSPPCPAQTVQSPTSQPARWRSAQQQEAGVAARLTRPPDLGRSPSQKEGATRYLPILSVFCAVLHTGCSGLEEDSFTNSRAELVGSSELVASLATEMPEPPTGSLLPPVPGSDLAPQVANLPSSVACPMNIEEAAPASIALRQAKEDKKIAAALAAGPVQLGYPSASPDYVQKQQQFLTKASALHALDPLDRESAYNDLKQQMLGGGNR